MSELEGAPGWCLGVDAAGNQITIVCAKDDHCIPSSTSAYGGYTSKHFQPCTPWKPTTLPVTGTPLQTVAGSGFGLLMLGAVLLRMVRRATAG